MRNWSVKGALLLLAVLVWSTGSAEAQNRAGTWELLPFGGYIDYSAPKLGDQVVSSTPNPPETKFQAFVSRLDDNPSWGFRFAYHWTKSHMIEFGVSAGSSDARIEQTTTVEDAGGMVISTEIKEQELDADIIVGQVSYVYNFFLHRRDKVVAYVVGGIGVISTSVFALADDPDFAAILDDVVGDNNNFAYNYGAGIRFFGSDKVGFRLEVRKYEYSIGERDDLDHVEASAGISIIIGGA